jgi:uncharacterized membrane protein
MRTPASIAGHPIHPMIVPLPIGLWIFSLVCDVVYLTGSANPDWSTVAFYTMGGGIVGALAAAVFGLVDLLALPPVSKRTALIHMSINLTIVVLYVINFWARSEAPDQPGRLIWLSLVSVVLLGISGWLGGKLVYEQGVAVTAATGDGRTAHAKSGGGRTA